jgi:hypothetical protein
LFAQTGTYSYDNSWGKNGLSIQNQKSNGIELNYSIKQFSISKMEVNGLQKHAVNLPNHFLPNNEGVPNLPGNGNYIAIPNGATASVEIVDSEWEIIENVEVAPAPRIPLDTENTPLEYSEKEEIYSADAFYPASPVSMSGNLNLRGVNTVIVGVTPFQYNPVTKQLKVYKNLKIQVNHTGGNGEYGETRLRNRWWDPIIKDAILNEDMLPEVDYSKRFQQSNSKDNEEYEYVIITPNNEEYLAWADSIRIFRNMQGIKTGIVTLADIGGNNVNAIEDYVDDIYNNWSVAPAAILLLGDYGSDAISTVVSPIYNEYCVSDNIYADVDGDQLPDVVFARITANNEEQLSVMVRKFIEYEKNPPTSTDFYNHPITALGWQTERWFQICSETVGGFWKNVLGKDPVRINAVYGGNPNSDPWSTATNTSTVLDYFGPNGTGYIPETPAELGGWEGGSSNDVTNAINAGAFMLQHRDHGGEDGWGEPDYSNDDINDLTNTDLTYVFSINCLTGKYNYSSEVFAEKFHRHTNGDQLAGALGIMAASEVSYSFVNDTYVWGMYDYMWPEFLPDYGGDFPTQRDVLPAFASAYGKHYLEQSSWPYNTDNKEVTYHLFHHHGDAFLNVYTEVPQNLTVSHDDVMVSGAPNFPVSADDGAYIALSVEGELIGTAEATGDFVEIPVEFQLPGTIIDVVVTKQNHFRYHAEVLVIPPDGPYVIKNAFDINDASGNNDGLADYGEAISLNVEMKNVGNEIAENVEVTISTDNPYVTLTDATETYGSFDAEEMININSAFAMSISDETPDQELVSLTVTATDGTEVWNSYIKFHINAPKLKVLDMEILETSGNGNGYFDAGETGEIKINFKNIGHSTAVDVVSALQTTSSYVSIMVDEDTFDGVNAEQVETATFIVEIDEATPNGTGVMLTNNVEAGVYSDSKEFTTKVGLIFEDWETGDLTNFPWQNNSESPWVMVEDVVYEGEYALKSGVIDHSESSVLELDYSSMGNDSISFFKKLSSEASFDFLKFYIDGEVAGQWSGNVDWSREVFFVPEGDHTFKWEYVKDNMVSSGDDCAWVDFIVFPPMLSTTAFAGADIQSCVGEDIVLNGSATYFESVLWETEGTGVISDPASLQTNYTPSEEDYNNGSVNFSLTAMGANGDIVTDHLVVTFAPELVLNLASELNVCEGSIANLNVEIENYESFEWTSNGDGVFENNGTIEATYQPGENDIANGNVVLSIHAEAMGSCTDLDQDLTLNINENPTTTFAGDFADCDDAEEEVVALTLTGSAPWTLTVVDELDGSSQEITAENANAEFGFNYGQNHEYKLSQLTDANGCSSLDLGVVYVTTNPDPAMPTAVIDVETIDHNVTSVSNFTGEDAEYATSYYWEIDPADAGTVVSDNQNVEITWNVEYEGDVTISYFAQNDCDITVFEKTISVYSSVGFGEFDGISTFEVYPNPASESFNLNVELDNREDIQITIVNTVGQKVWTATYNDVERVSEKIQTSKFAKGSYMIRIQGVNINNYKKLIVK